MNTPGVMEPTTTSTPWYRSMKVLLIATILLPPVGLVMLWLRKDTETGMKVFASLAILVLSAAYLFYASISGLFVRPDPSLEAHYAELERQRAEQQQAVATGPSGAPTTADPKASPASSIAANANESKTAVAVPLKSNRSYWTNFRGPARDGRYDETPI